MKLHRMSETADLITSGKRKGPEEIRAEIEKTRAEVTETINEIRERLSSAHLREQAQGATFGRARRMAEATAAKTKEWGSHAVENVRQRPIPYTVIGAVGVGMGALIWILRRKRGDSHPEREAPTGDFPGPGEPSLEEGRSSESGATAKERARAIRGQAKEKAEELKSKVEAQSRYLKNRLGELLERNPLAVGAAFFALGTILGLSIPISARERRWMGKTRDSLLESAKERVLGAMEKEESAALEY